VSSFRVIDRAALIDELALLCWPGDVFGGALDAARGKAAEALARWSAAGLPSAAGPDGPRYDNFEVLNFMKSVGLAAGDPTFADFVEASRRRAAELPVDDRPRRFRIDLVREIAPRALAGPRCRVELPLPLEGEVEVQLEPPRGLAGAIERTAAGLSIPLEVRGDDPIRLQARIDLLASGVVGRQRRRATSQMVPPELAPDPTRSERLCLHTPAIEVLSRRAAAGSDDLWDLLDGFWRVLFGELRVGYLHYEQLAAPDGDFWRSLLAGTWGDCLLISALLAAVCRARGFPARVAGGHFLYRLDPALHFWAEVWVPDEGWLPFDCMGWDLAAGDPREETWAGWFFGRREPRATLYRFPEHPITLIGPRTPACMLRRSPDGAWLERSWIGRDDQRLRFRDLTRVSS
jgi:hypothetical protein